MTLELLGIASFTFVAVFTARAYTNNSGFGQTPRSAIIEAWVNIAIGFSLNMAVNVVLIPMMTNGAHVSASDNWWGGWCYTAISIVRQYVIRRWFNNIIHNAAEKLAGKTA